MLTCFRQLIMGKHEVRTMTRNKKFWLMILALGIVFPLLMGWPCGQRLECTKHPSFSCPWPEAKLA
jgi:hypothetical protein